MHVLLSNDDGLEAEGLQLLRSTLKRVRPDWRITTVAPDRERSAASHALTLTRPLRMEPHGEDQYAVSGTPTDCVLLAMNVLLADDRPDVVVSGINHGPNMGEDVIYSGTVAAAMEGTMFGIPSYALSLAKWHPIDFSGAAEYLKLNLERILEFPLRRGTLMNINLPEGPLSGFKGTRVTRLGNRVYQNVITDQVDPHGKPYFWIGGQGPTWSRNEGSDYNATQDGFVSLTALMVDLTHYGLLQEMKNLERDGVE